MENHIESDLGNLVNVMVIDDQPMICDLVENIIDSHGRYKAYTFQSPEKALADYKDNPTRYGVVLVDKEMPIYSGIEVIQRMQDINPRQKFIIMSGYDRADSQEFIDSHGIYYLGKPVTMIELFGALKIALENA